jgi:DNA-directed RNA polymerase alpha subunit
MTEPTTPSPIPLARHDFNPSPTPLAGLAERVHAGSWWKEGALDQPNELVLPTRVLVALENAGITTVEDLKAAGPNKLRSLPNLGKLGFQQIIDLLRALDKSEPTGGAHAQS